MLKGDFDHIQECVDNFATLLMWEEFHKRYHQALLGSLLTSLRIGLLFPALHGVLSNSHLEFWRHFVLANMVLCKCTLTPHDVGLADALLMQFCRRVEQLYGLNSITSNM